MDLKEFKELLIDSYIYCYYSKSNKNYTLYGIYIGESSTGTHKFIMRNERPMYFNKLNVCHYQTKSIQETIVKLEPIVMYCININWDRAFEEFGPFLLNYKDKIDDQKKKPFLL